ncbi:MAG: anthranilate synthase component I [Acidimicrobiia bacterium]|nr:MAG: anthranilate synthase component I [Acidimicrobiia bacterium]
MSKLTIHPGPSEFARLASEYPVVPVWTELLCDRDTPVSAFEKLVGDGTGFLLESVEGGERWARWSFLGWDPALTLVARNGRAEFEGRDGAPPGDPLTVFSEVLAGLGTPTLEGLPPLHSGVVGYLGYDCVRYIEELGDGPPDDRGLPEMLWQFVGALCAIDRFSHRAVLVRNVYRADDPRRAYREACELLEGDADRLGSELTYRPGPPPQVVSPGSVSSTFDQAGFEAAVAAAKDYIRRGDAFQIVLSQRLATPWEGDPFDVYRALRVINPSPYLFFLRHPEVTVAGSSPELMTRVRDGVVYSRPIAGTRPRGATEDQDKALEEELLADPKERAEHVMLVDLARNDLGRVCEFGTVTVDELMVVERYSHVMHIVSGVSGKLRPGVGPIDVLRATFPHGTVTGAPKVRAMEIIDELEPVARGPYAGAVGYVDFTGNVDTAICLRTVVFGSDTAWVQAGAGVVADSDPEAEYHETMNKAAAGLAAVEAARRTGRRR